MNQGSLEQEESQASALSQNIEKLLAELTECADDTVRLRRINRAIAALSGQDQLTQQAVKTAVVKAGHITAQAWNAMMKEALAGQAKPQPQDADKPDRGGKEPSQASKLVALADELYDLFRGTDGKPYAVDHRAPSIALSMRGRDGVRQRLARVYYEQTGTVASGSALSDALQVLEGQAADADARPVWLRVARDTDGQIVLDLGEATGRAVVVRPGSWEIVQTSPVLFRRTALTSVLEAPTRPGNLGGFRKLVNVDDEGFHLQIAWMIAAMIPDIPHPILILNGEQGTAKTTAARFCVRLIDPSPAPARSAPPDVGEWAVVASAGWTIVLDNVSAIQPWFSDTLCKAVTGDGIVKRSLFTDDDVTVLSFRRAIVITGIDGGPLAGDLAERLLPVELQVISGGKRRSEKDIEAAFTTIAPATLAGLLDLLAGVLVTLPKVKLDELPRMADFTLILAALDQNLGWRSRDAYLRRIAENNRAVLDGDPFALAIVELMKGQAEGWAGTAQQLFDHLTPDRPPQTWPRSPRGVGGAVSRLAPALRSYGIEVEKTRAHGGDRIIRLWKSQTTEGTVATEEESTVTTVTTVTSNPIPAGQMAFEPGDGGGVEG